MKRALVIGVVCAGAMLTGVTAGVAATPSPTSVAAKACSDERQADGRAAFREKYGERAMRTCIGETKPEAAKAIKSASRECRAERSADPVAFHDTWDNAHGKNAMGRCVSTTAREELAES